MTIQTIFTAKPLGERDYLMEAIEAGQVLFALTAAAAVFMACIVPVPW
jgi:hypothetical protein